MWVCKRCGGWMCMRCGGWMCRRCDGCVECVGVMGVLSV